MKKKIAFILVGCVAFGVFVSQFLLGGRPFKNITVDEIKSVTVFLSPPEITLTLTQEQIKKFVPLFRELVTYQRDDSYIEYSGQNCVFTVTKTDGSQFRVNCANPFIVINGDGYRTKYDACNALHSFGNTLLY